MSKKKYIYESPDGGETLYRKELNGQERKFVGNVSQLPFIDNKKNKYRGTTFIQTVAKPDLSLRGLKVSLPKPVVNNTWQQLTNNEAHRILHPLVGNKIKFFWKF